ncbi:MAG: hypothetical protein QW331_04825 [Candidatus Woesearchaeota archaeon]
MERCCGTGCMRCSGIKWLIVGIVIILNELYRFASWALLIGALIALGGLIKATKHKCSCSMSGKKKR